MCIRDSAEDAFVFTRSLLGVRQFTAYAVHVRGRHGHLRQHRLDGHSIVAVWMIRLHVTLVAPEEMDIAPSHPRTKRRRGQQLIDTLRRRPAAQGDRTSTARRD